MTKEERMEREKRSTCIDCGRTVVHPGRSMKICIDCLIGRIAWAIPPKNRGRFLTGFISPEAKK